MSVFCDLKERGSGRGEAALERFILVSTKSYFKENAFHNIESAN